MILKELLIKNFRSYYGNGNRYIFNPNGLTLIVGDNGDGKTTFVESLEWLFNDNNLRNIDDSRCISEMRKSEMDEGDIDEVRVSITFDHDGEKELTKAISFQKLSNGNVKILSREFLGYDSNGIERKPIDGNIFLKLCFDSEIRRYSIFKGETQLDIFHNDTQALKRLLHNFSDIKRLDEFVELTEDMTEMANKAYTRELKNDKHTQSAASILEKDLFEVKSKISDVRRQIKDHEENSRTYKSRIDTMVDNRELKERLDCLNAEIKKAEDEIRKNRVRIMIDYNHSLLDKSWILCAFQPIMKEYNEKVSALSSLKRRMDREFNVELGKKKQLQELMLPNGVEALPWYMPDEETMRDMIKDCTCKVCGRPAPVGSESYNYMVEKLNQYLEHLVAENQVKQEVLFPHSYIEELHKHSYAKSGIVAKDLVSIYPSIKEELDFVASRQREIAKKQEELDGYKDEKARLLIEYHISSEDDLNKSASDMRDFMERHESAIRKINDLNQILNDLRAKQNDFEQQLANLKPGTKMAERYGRIHGVLNQIYKAFGTARDSNRRRFIDHLTQLSNRYLDQLNVSDFHGVIEIYRHQESGDIDIILKSANGVYVTNPSESQKTTMFMSVLFAIAQITADKQETEYPLIFDAPTSSFSSMKETEFYEVINKIKKQCVIVTKDMLEYDAQTKSSHIKDSAYSLSCPIYRIEKQHPFDQSDLSTIRVTTTKIKD